MNEIYFKVKITMIPTYPSSSPSPAELTTLRQQPKFDNNQHLEKFRGVENMVPDFPVYQYTIRKMAAGLLNNSFFSPIDDVGPDKKRTGQTHRLEQYVPYLVLGSELALAQHLTSGHDQVQTAEFPDDKFEIVKICLENRGITYITLQTKIDPHLRSSLRLVQEKPGAKFVPEQIIFNYKLAPRRSGILSHSMGGGIPLITREFVDLNKIRPTEEISATYVDATAGVFLPLLHKNIEAVRKWY